MYTLVARRGVLYTQLVSVPRITDVVVVVVFVAFSWKLGQYMYLHVHAPFFSRDRGGVAEEAIASLERR